MVLVNGDDPTEQPRLMVAVTQQITDGHDPARTVSERFEFMELRTSPDSCRCVNGEGGCPQRRSSGSSSSSAPTRPG